MKFPLDRLQVEADSLLDSFHVFYSSSSLKKIYLIICRVMPVTISSDCPLLFCAGVSQFWLDYYYSAAGNHMLRVLRPSNFSSSSLCRIACSLNISWSVSIKDCTHLDKSIQRRRGAYHAKLMFWHCFLPLFF